MSQNVPTMLENTIAKIREMLDANTVVGKIGRDNIHIITGTDRFLLFLNFGPVQIRYGSLNGLDGTDLVNGADMNIDQQMAFHIQKVFQNFVLQFRGQDLQITDGSIFASHSERAGLIEQEGTGGNKVLGIQTGGHQPIPGKQKRLRRIHPQNVVEYPQPLLSVQSLCRYAQLLEVADNIVLNTLQPVFCRLEIVGLHAECEIFAAVNTAVAFGSLLFQHSGVFPPDAIIVIPFGPDAQIFSQHLAHGRQVTERKLEANGTVEVVHEVAPAVEDFLLVLVAG